VAEGRETGQGRKKAERKEERPNERTSREEGDIQACQKLKGDKTRRKGATKLISGQIPRMKLIIVS
jgi:hypothetical protein